MLDFEGWGATDPVNIGAALVNAANEGDEIALRWISRLTTKGVTASLLKDVQRMVRRLDAEAVLMLDKESKSFEWKLQVDDGVFANREILLAYAVAWIITADRVSSLTKCALPDEIRKLARSYPFLRDRIKAGAFDCDNYVFSYGKKIYCSGRCSSRYRVTKDRASKK